MKEKNRKVVELTSSQEMDYQADYEDIQPATTGQES
jgi:hypothetical protein